MSKIICLIAIAIIVGGAIMARASCPPNVDDAALRNIYPKFDWMTGESAFSGRVSLADVRTEREKIAKYRTWANGLKDLCARRAYLRWIAVHEREVNETEEELRTHKIRRAHEAWKRKEDERSRRADQGAEKLPKTPGTP